MIKLCQDKSCTGCAACCISCPKKAISMKTDKYGFMHPVINHDKCIQCRKCVKICPVINHVPLNYPLSAFACYDLDNNSRLTSSSGAFSAVICKYIIEMGGVVYGCVFEPPFSVKHIRCTTINEVDQLRGSKYVQSCLEDVLKLILDDLKRHRIVLFIGTPCQVAAVKSLSGKSECLITLDIICHGIPSMKFLKDTVPLKFQKLSNSKLFFRINTRYHFLIKQEEHITVFERPLSKDIYMKGFFNGVTFRNSCFRCLYAQNKRGSDITCGDFWGLKSSKVKNIEDGVSLVLINTNKGSDIFKKLRVRMWVEQRPISEALSGNEQLNKPFKYSLRVRIFRFLYPIVGYRMALVISLPDKVIAMKIKHLINSLS